MFPSVSSSHVHPGSVHVPPEFHPSEPPRPSAPISIHVSTQGSPTHVGDSTPQLLLPAAYISRPSGKLHPDLVHPGVQIDEKGRRFVSDGKATYAIRYDRDHRTERVYQPHDPVKPGIAVRINVKGELRHRGDLGLKGGSPYLWFHSTLGLLQGTRGRRVAEVQQAERNLTSLDAELRQLSRADANVQSRRDHAQRQLEESQRGLESIDQSIESLRRDIRQCQQQTQNDLRQQQTLRDDGARKERNIEFDINFLQTAINVNSRATGEQQNTLHRLRNDLGQVQTENRALDDRIRNLNQELADLATL
ncbi:hypothetical protein LFL96_30340 [Paraburkholderia sp. D15]|uniref:hypothetical protein n=1 Tax=Paraburkholderia sp. D15 TaxID=2880218 RepID=UPI00247A9F14|nr:hypothetical protein [Paraburkholderia sp. D15]WGS52489.1 hypothetical protein LFL96_30340 [Paraburkholderia sp. D15]